MIVNILGTEYTIVMGVPSELMPEDADGAIDNSIKRIEIGIIKQERNSIKNIEQYKKQLLRHEIIHAFLYESGLWNNSGYVDSWATNEEITDWIAIQFPKILKAFNDVGAL